MPRQSAKAPKLKTPPPRQRILSIAQLDEARLKAAPEFAPYIPEPPVIAAGKVGRPSSYDPRYRQIVLDQAALGHTIGGTAALIGVARSTILDWASAYSEFAEALALAKAVRQRFYEGHLIDMARRAGDSTRMSAVKLGLLNTGADDWKERLTAEHNVAFSLADLVEQSIKLVGSRDGSTLIEHNETAASDPLEPGLTDGSTSG